MLPHIIDSAFNIDIDNIEQECEDILFEMCHPKFVAVVENITGLSNLIPDISINDIIELDYGKEIHPCSTSAGISRMKPLWHKITATLMLNDKYQNLGGELIIIDGDKTTKITPIMNRLVIHQAGRHVMTGISRWYGIETWKALSVRYMTTEMPKDTTKATMMPTMGGTYTTVFRSTHQSK